MATCTRYNIHYVIKFINEFRQVDGFLWVLRFPPPIKLTARYSWNIVESGIKHHNPNPVIFVLYTNIILGPTHYKTSYFYLHFENINHDGFCD